MTTETIKVKDVVDLKTFVQYLRHRLKAKLASEYNEDDDITTINERQLKRVHKFCEAFLTNNKSNTSTCISDICIGNIGNITYKYFIIKSKFGILYVRCYNIK